MRVAVVGIGVLGRAVAARLQRAGHTVVAYNRTSGKAEALRPLGVVVADSPALALREADCTLLFLTDAPAIRSVLFREDTRPALAGRTVIQMGTIGPDESRAVAETVLAEGGDYLEAPVLGSVAEAQAGNLLVMVGGSRDQMRRWEPLLQTLSNEPRFVGSIGQAASLKLALNHLIAAETAAFSLSLALIQRSQVPVDLFMSILKDSALFAPTFDKKLPRLQARRYDDPNFSTRHLLKDVDLFVAAAREHGLRTSSLDGVRQILVDAIAHGSGDVDYSVLYEEVLRGAQR
ncbi:NAD(P)-dependent oxidoreductase [Nitrospira moscoviensis]|uniref:3-hydroxyacid dehydrogenase n=1 Tax=Nitrospira moscoviensis TaxID=42253 RepID=A0A0K2GK06_NITMO|nr:NAD(P)-dependent oxidoreductase [Nitrospira moscoviensis]ALA61189.1 3-hydroxyacid dehydrogenase [Nitrospira moscoviensis]